MKIALFLGITLTPFYLFESGGLQVAHIFFAIFMIMRWLYLKLNINYDASQEKIFIFFGFYAFYAVVRDLISYSRDESLESLLNAVHIIYTFLLCISTYQFVKNRNFIFFKPIALSLVIATIGVIYYGFGLTNSDFSERPVGTFNNPNQLGYFSVICAAFFSFLLINKSIRLHIYVFFLALCLFLSVVSLSKAAILAILVSPVFFIIYVINSLEFKKIGFYVIFAAIALVILALTIGVWQYDAEELIVYNRLLNYSEENDSSLEVRGYNVFASASPIEIIFGLSVIKTMVLRDGAEIHSTFMAPITYYGVIGGGFFITFILLWLLRIRASLGWLGVGMVCLPIILYGITHNGGRFTLLWVLVGASLAFAPTRNVLFNSPRTPRPYDIRKRAVDVSPMVSS
jgi:hypothetical protein